MSYCLNYYSFHIKLGYNNKNNNMKPPSIVPRIKSLFHMCHYPN